MAAIPEIEIPAIQDEQVDKIKKIIDEPIDKYLVNEPDASLRDSKKQAFYNRMVQNIEATREDARAALTDRREAVEGGSKRSIAEKAARAYHWFLRLVSRKITPTGSTTPENAYPDGVLHPKAEAVFQELAKKNVDIFSSASLHRVIDSVIKDQSHGGDYFSFTASGSQIKSPFEKDFEEIALTNPFAAQTLREVVKKVVMGDPTTFADTHKEIATDPHFLDKKLAVEITRGPEDSRKEVAILGLIEDDIDSVKNKPEEQQRIKETAGRAKEMIQGLHSISAFNKFYRDQFDREIEKELRATRGPGSPPLTEQEIFKAKSDATIKEKIGKKVAKNVQETVLYVVNTIYRNVLNDNNEPHSEFRTAASETDPFLNPNILYKYFNDRLVSLKSTAARYTHENGSDLPYYTFKRQKQRVYNEAIDQEEDIFAITPDLEEDNLSAFLAEQEQISETELGLLEYDYNFRLLTRHGAQREGARISEEIARYSFERATTDAFDRLKVLKDNQYITIAQTAILNIMARRIAEKGHVKTRDLSNDLFTREGTILSEVNDMLAAQYPDLDTWERNRIVRHARMRVEGAELMGLMWISYADPPQGFQGEEDIGGRNSIFSWQEDAMRWGYHDPKHDLHYKGAIFFPHEGKIENYDHTELINDGHAIWQGGEGMLKYGHLACFEKDHFWDEKNKKVIIPVIATPGNITQTGGPNTLMGWRVRMGLTPVIRSYIEKTKRGTFEVDYNQKNVLTNIWKSVENSGVNNIRTLLESDDFTGKISVKHGHLDSGAFDKYHSDLLRFIYNKYFTSGVGQSLGEGAANADEYVQKVKAEIEKEMHHIQEHPHGINPKEIDKALKAAAQKVFKSKVYDAMTVMIFERTPTEFLYRPRSRDEQNGITPWVQVNEQMKSQWRRQNVNLSEQELNEWWKETNNDLIYVQMEARRQTTEEIERNKAQWGNIYGDLSKSTSEVLGGQGYKIDANYIRIKLTEKYEKEFQSGGQNINDPGVRAQITEHVDRTVDMYNTLEKCITSKPVESELEKKWRDNGDNEKADRAQDWKKKRINWFSDAWQKNMFGSIPFLMDKSWTWETESLSDRNVVRRSASTCAVTAEEMHERRTSRKDPKKSFILLAKGTVRKGEDQWVEFKNYVSQMGTTLGDELDGPIVKDIKMQEIRRFLTMMMKDDKARTWYGEVESFKKRGRTSVAADAWTTFIGHDFGASDMRGFLEVMVKENTIKLEEEHALLDEFKASWPETINELAPKILIIALVLGLLHYMREAYKEELDAGSH